MKHTELPWSYRPYKYDDWGVIKSKCGRFIINVRDLHVTEEDKDQHRKDKTDPYEKIGTEIVHAVNNHYKLVEAVNELCAALSERGIAGKHMELISKAKALASATGGGDE